MKPSMMAVLRKPESCQPAHSYPSFAQKTFTSYRLDRAATQLHTSPIPNAPIILSIHAPPQHPQPSLPQRTKAHPSTPKWYTRHRSSNTHKIQSGTLGTPYYPHAHDPPHSPIPFNRHYSSFSILIRCFIQEYSHAVHIIGLLYCIPTRSHCS